MSTSVHGMGGDLVAPHWPPVTHAEAEMLLAAYGREVVRVAWRSPRPLSAAALVETDRGTVFVKRHAARVRDADGLAEEHAFAAHLRGGGVPVPEVLRTTDGRTAVADGPWTWEVHARAPGRDTYRDAPSWTPFRSTEHAHTAGAALARLQVAAEGFAAPARRPQLLTAGWDAVRSPDLVDGVRAYAAARPLVAAALARRDWTADVHAVLKPLHARLRPYVPDLPPGWTHGDGHASNLLWTPDGEVAAVLDLGLADRTTPLLDLATAIERGTVSWLDPSPAARLDHVDALVAGWSCVRPLTDLEAAALPELLPLVHVDLALSETGYFAGVTGSRTDTNLAYDGYLLGHARWFAGPGSALLAHLRPGRRRTIAPVV